MDLRKDPEKINDEQDAASYWRNVPGERIIALLILVFPVGLYLVWRQDRWPKRTKKITTWVTSAVLVTLFALTLLLAPPAVSITSSLASVKSGSYQLVGRVSPASSVVTVNGVQAAVTGDTFSSNVQLREGDNTLKVVAVSGSKRTEQAFKIHRYTHAEILAQEKTAAREKAATP